MTDTKIAITMGKAPDLAAIFSAVNGKAKQKFKASLAKEKSVAKTATVTAKMAKAFAKTAAKAEAANAKWERPNLYALCRKLAGGDMAAGLMLFHILYLWRNRDHKLTRNGREWLAHPREAWAAASGLSFDEFTKRALPRLKRNCCEFLTIKAMGQGAQKKLWVHLDENALSEAVSGPGSMPWDMFQLALNGIGIGNKKKPANAYADPFKG